MSEGVVSLRLHTPPPSALDVTRLTADRCAHLGEDEIARLPAWLGRREVAVGDFFHVRGGRADQLRLEGPLGRVHGVGEGMSGGTLIIDGDAGARVAAGMTGGSVEVRGRVGDEAGLAMQGGVLRVRADAGDRLGAAAPGVSKGMTGGEIVVGGSAGTGAAARVRRGLVVVGGDVAERGGEGLIAGTLVVLGRTGAGAGTGSRRGSIVACGGIEVPRTYRYACTYEAPWVRLLLTWLRRQYQMPVPDAVRDGVWRRYCGDAGVPGRGEILVWDGARRG